MFYAPDEATLGILLRVLKFPIDYYWASPRRKRTEFRWPTLKHAIENVLERPDLIEPWVFTVFPWIMEFLKRLRDKLEEMGAP